MKTISSRTNPAIKHAASLHNKKYRAKHQQFIAEGLRSVSTLIHSNNLPEALYVTENRVSDAQKLVDEYRIYLVEDHVMEKISSTSTPSGIVGVFPIPPEPSPDTLGAGIVLAQISDPGNMGTLIRTAAALNTQSIVIIQGTDPWSPKVVQASAGTIGIVSIFQWSWDKLQTHKGKNKLCALTIAGGKKPAEIDFKHTLLVVGSEAHGIPEERVANCDEKLTLPMPGGAESLNAAVAGSIALYLAYQAQ